MDIDKSYAMVLSIPAISVNAFTHPLFLNFIANLEPRYPVYNTKIISPKFFPNINFRLRLLFMG